MASVSAGRRHSRVVGGVTSTSGCTSRRQIALAPLKMMSLLHRDTPNEQTCMSVGDRSAGRNVHIYDAKDPDTVIGGLILTNGVTNANFCSMVEIFCIFDGNYVLRHGDGMTIPRDGDPLRPGKYYILTDGMLVFLRDCVYIWLGRC
jgi:hypothetical protein